MGVYFLRPSCGERFYKVKNSSVNYLLGLKNPGLLKAWQNYTVYLFTSRKVANIIFYDCRPEQIGSGKSWECQTGS